MSRKLKSHSLFLWILIVEFYFFSGEVYYTSFVLGGGGKLQILYLIQCFVFYFSTNGSSRRFNRTNLCRLLFVMGWVFLSTFIFGKGEHGLLWTSYISFSISVFLLMESVDADILNKALLKVLVVLTVISIVVQLCNNYLGLFPPSIYVDGTGITRSLSLKLFTIGDDKYRLSSFFWEPGQYQIVLYFILILFAEKWLDIKNWKSNLKTYGILGVAIIMTGSTTAYLALFFVVFAFLSKNALNNKVLLPVYAALGLLIGYFIFQSEAIQKKMNERENDENRSSYTIRMADNLACLDMTMESPIIGFGPGSDVLEKGLIKAGSETSSNGWLYGSAQLGIPYLLFLWFCIYKKLRQRHPFKIAFFLLCALIISHSGEANITLPYMYLYVFKQKRDYTRVQYS